MPLTDELASQIASTVSKRIVSQTLPATNRPQSLGAVQQTQIEANWEKIINLIVKEVFDQIKLNAVIEVKELISIQVAAGLLSSTGPVAGVVVGGSPQPTTPGSPPSPPPTTSSVDLRGKIT